MKDKLCIFLTKQENRCKRKALPNSNLCSQHRNESHSLDTHTEKDLHNIPTEIVHGLFLGSKSKVCDEKWLVSHNIKVIINATDDMMCSYGKQIKFYMWNMQDCPSENIIPYLERSSKIIDTALSKKQGILIHCHMGISRSASLVWYWLSTRKYRGDYKAALLFLELKRWIVNPNPGFKRQIIKELKKIQF